MLRAGSRTGRDVERLLRDGVDPPGGDGPLLRRFLESRDESAFEAIVDRHGPLVLSLCKRYLREPADVEDAFQATFLVLVRKGAGLCEAQTLAGWLHGVAHRVAFRARSDVLKRRSREGDRDGVQEATAAQAKPADDSLEVLDGELARLPEKYRAPLVLCYLRGRTHDQAADELGWPVGTVRSRMARGRSILHDRLSRRGLDASACLAAARLDLASAAVPSSLVAATASAAGRFAALAAGLGWIWRASPSSTYGPEALAEGVLSTMSTTPWKLLGLAFLSTGLTAGAVALAAGPSSGPANPQEPPKAQAKPDPKPEVQGTDSALKSVESRLSDVEQKLDRLIGLMEKGPASPATTANGGAGEPASPRSLDAKGLREIEAELINNYHRYQYTEKLVQRQVVSKGEIDSVVAPARLLVARLREMEADALKAEEKAQRLAFPEDRSRLRGAIDEAKENLEQARLAALKAGLSQTDLQALMSGFVFAQPSRFETQQAQSERERLRSKLTADLASDSYRNAAFGAYRGAREHLIGLESWEASFAEPLKRYEESKSRTQAIQKLISWAKEHFKDVELTIEDTDPVK